VTEVGTCRPRAEKQRRHQQTERTTRKSSTHQKREEGQHPNTKNVLNKELLLYQVGGVKNASLGVRNGREEVSGHQRKPLREGETKQLLGNKTWAKQVKKQASKK